MLKRFSLPYLIIGLGFAIILATLTWWVGSERSSDSAGGAAPVPERLAGKPLTAHASGPGAVSEIESLHGKGFPLVGGTVARYGDAMVWVAYAEDEAGARAMTELMTTRIAEGRSPFRPTGTRQVGDYVVFTLTGMGQSHFYWQSGDKVIWLAISPGQAGQGLRELMLALN